ncbi:MAG: phosphoribosylanthranilate isomerase [Gammaproteobacteria bacterium]|nr:phosphoribosylanthranilate isomerase [Gammaproteobacteria bacterium]
MSSCPRTRIKFCGITRLIDALSAVELGVDALGFVFYQASPRWITPQVAREIVRALPPFVSTVGLFVNAPLAELREIVATTGIDVVQFHGRETAAECAASPRPYVKVVRMEPGLDLPALATTYRTARALLVDTYDPVLPGGTGRVFDWSRIPASRDFPVILAGGLSAANVAEALSIVRPYAVDVSGGIESSKGIKDPVKMQAFITEVKNFERDA